MDRRLAQTPYSANVTALPLSKKIVTKFFQDFLFSNLLRRDNPISFPPVPAQGRTRDK
jgi:hypothetical protein